MLKSILLRCRSRELAAGEQVGARGSSSAALLPAGPVHAQVQIFRSMGLMYEQISAQEFAEIKTQLAQVALAMVEIKDPSLYP